MRKVIKILLGSAIVYGGITLVNMYRVRDHKEKGNILRINWSDLAYNPKTHDSSNENIN